MFPTLDKPMDHERVGVKGEYHGIIIKEGIKHCSFIDAMRILGRKKGGSWTLLKVSVDSNEIEQTISKIQHNLLSEAGIPFYSHFYRDGELIVVFPQRIFRASPERETWKEIINYGMSLGIPSDELDFKPSKFEEETY